MRYPVSPTNRAMMLVAAGVPLSLLLGAALPSLWVVGLAWLVLVLLLLGADLLLCLSGPVPMLDAQTPASLQVNRPARVPVRIDFGGRPPADIELALSASDRIGVYPDRLNGRPADAHEFVLAPLRRGHATIDHVWVRWRGPLGLIRRQLMSPIDAQIPVLINTHVAREMAGRLRSRAFEPGSSIRLEGGEGGDLNALKEFTAGSDRRMIDWKQSARHGSLLTRDYRAERSARIMLVVDSGRVMAEAIDGTPRIDHALTAALAVAYSALKDGDRVGFLSFDSAPRIVSGLTSGAHAFGSLQRLVSRVDYSAEETDFSDGVTALLGALERRAIVIVFTDFNDSHASTRMLGNVARLLTKHVVLFVSFRDQDLETIAERQPTTGRDVARAVVAGELLDERRSVFHDLRQAGAHVLELSVTDAAPLLLSKYLLLKRDFVR